MFTKYSILILTLISIPSALYGKTAAGALLFFDDGTVLLGKEYRSRCDRHVWMEFGGEQDENETLAQTALRETNEETAQTLDKFLTLTKVQEAEENGHYIEHNNLTTGVTYRMYFIRIHGEKPLLETFRENAKKLGSDANVEKEDWGYFDASVIMNAHNQEGNLPGTNEPLYDTMKARLKKPKTQEFFKEFLQSLKKSL